LPVVFTPLWKSISRPRSRVQGFRAQALRYQIAPAKVAHELARLEESRTRSRET